MVAACGELTGVWAFKRIREKMLAHPEGRSILKDKPLLNSSTINFNELEKLPDEYADLMLTVSTLHEMRADQILHYLRVVDRLCGGAFYSKQWRRFYNDLDDITPTRETYPIPLRWSLVFERSALVPRTFFEALYLCRSGVRGLDR